MKKYCKALVNIAVAAAILAAVIFLLPRVFLFFMPFVAGWIVALIAGPLVRFFEEKIKLKRKAGSAFVIVVIIALVVLALYLICAQLFQQVSGLVKSLPNMLESMESDFNSIGKRLNVLLARLPGNLQLDFHNDELQLDSYLGDLLEKLGSPTIEAAGNLAKLLPGIFIGVIMALLSAYFFVAERHQLNEWFRKYMPASMQMRYRIIRRSLGKSVGGYFKAQIKIEVWMYFLLLLGLGILRVDYFALIALGIAFLDFLPFLGTGTALIPWAVVKILTADYKTAIGLLVIWGVGQLARQLIQPKIVGDSIGVPPLPTLFLLFIGYKLGGVLGMILAVPLGLLAYSLYEEGAFDTTKNSVLILMAGINRFRKLDKRDLSEVEEMSRRNEETAKILARESQQGQENRQSFDDGEK